MPWFYFSDRITYILSCNNGWRVCADIYVPAPVHLWKLTLQHTNYTCTSSSSGIIAMSARPWCPQLSMSMSGPEYNQGRSQQSNWGRLISSTVLTILYLNCQVAAIVLLCQPQVSESYGTMVMSIWRVYGEWTKKGFQTLLLWSPLKSQWMMVKCLLVDKWTWKGKEATAEFTCRLVEPHIFDTAPIWHRPTDCLPLVCQCATNTEP